MPLFVAAHVGGRPLFEVLFLFLQRPWLIWNFAALHDALSRRAGAIFGHDFRMRSWLGFVILKIPVRSDERLPNSIQIRMAVGHARGTILLGRGLLGLGLLGRGLLGGQPKSGKRGGRRNQKNRDLESVTHRCHPRTKICSHRAISGWERSRKTGPPGMALPESPV